MSQEEFSQNFSVGAGNTTYTWTVLEGAAKLDSSILASPMYVSVFFHLYYNTVFCYYCNYKYYEHSNYYLLLLQHLFMLTLLLMFSDGPNLIFKPNVFFDELYTLQLHAVYSINSTYNISGSASVTFRINTPPTGVVLQVL